MRDLRKVKSNARLGLRLWLSGGWLLLLVVGSGFCTAWIAPQDPLDARPVSGPLTTLLAYNGSEPGYLLGTDSLGRDVSVAYSLWCARLALIVALVAGTSHLFDRGKPRPDRRLLSAVGPDRVIISRFVDIWMAFPPVLFAILLLIAVLGHGADLNHHSDRHHRLDPLRPRCPRRSDERKARWTMWPQRPGRGAQPRFGTMLDGNPAQRICLPSSPY